MTYLRPCLISAGYFAGIYLLTRFHLHPSWVNNDALVAVVGLQYIAGLLVLLRQLDEPKNHL